MDKEYLPKAFNEKKLKKKEKSSKKKIIIAIVLIIFLFSGSFLIYFIMQISLNTNTPMVVVVSGSMEPNLLKGDLLFLKGRDPATIKSGTIEGKEGDIIVFDARNLPGWIHPPSDPIVHRVIDKIYDNGWLFLTKGDANPTPDDGWVPESRILGVVCGRIPYVGWVKILLTDSGLLIPLLVIVSTLLIISIIWDIVKKEDVEVEGKKKGEKQRIFNPKAKDDDSVREIELDYSKYDDFKS
ncbi:MAG: signal peptidase I [Candidatus Lokiarchaeota archaeon]|nr:signal peptidase I [Candidatus Lokiarchaeota archaeon]